MEQEVPMSEQTYIEHKRCGHCCKFMTSDCPYEHNVVGRGSGPAMDTFPCDEFIMKPWFTDKIERLERYEQGNI